MNNRNIGQDDLNNLILKVEIVMKSMKNAYSTMYRNKKVVGTYGNGISYRSPREALPEQDDHD